MNFFQAIKSGFKNYFNLSGRASRSEFWYWMLFTVMALVVWCVIGFVYLVILLSPLSPHQSNLPAAIYIIGYYSLILGMIGIILPYLAITVRRLHDINCRGWWVLFNFTVIGAIFTIVLSLFRGTTGDNRFGPDPLQKQSPILH